MRKRKKTGPARMMELGWKPIQLWVFPRELAKLKQAARRCGLSMNAFCCNASNASAARVLAKGDATHEEKSK